MPPPPPPMLQQHRRELPDAVFVLGAGAAEAKKGGATSSGNNERHQHHHNQAMLSAAARERRSCHASSPHRQNEQHRRPPDTSGSSQTLAYPIAEDAAVAAMVAVSLSDDLEPAIARKRMVAAAWPRPPSPTIWSPPPSAPASSEHVIMGAWVKTEWEQGKGSFAFLELKKGGAVFIQ
uniref:Uncharacterized protein n=1 Tax=Oryza rufipogon TaxID=4529 RepID=A0A0E0P181_ORYRU